MSNFEFVGQTDLLNLRDRLEKLTKSFSALGYQGLQNAGRTGISALAIDSCDPVMYSICAQERSLKLMKNIKTVKATQPVYFYKVQTSIATQGLDLAGWENFMPQEDAANYENVAEPLKIYGIRKTLGDMVRMTQEAGGFFDGVDVEKENERNAAMALSTQFERDGYAGGDYYISSTGAIDTDVPLKFYGNRKVPAVRQLRGIQSNIREGDISSRGVTPDFRAYGNSYSVQKDQRGARLDQDTLDDVSTAVSSQEGQIGEAHATPAQIAEFRKTFYGIQRGDINQNFAIRGPDIQNGEDQGFAVTSVGGMIKFIPCIYKNSVRQKPVAVQGTNGAAPIAPTITSVTEVAGLNTELIAGDTLKFVIQAGNLFGLSSGTTSALQTVVATGAGFDIVIAAQTDAEYFNVFMTPREAAAKLNSEGFVGRILKAVSGGTTFRYASAVMPGYESVLFMPSASEDRVKLAVLGNLLNKSDLGRQGLALETVFSSYLCIVLNKPRTFFVLDNVQQRRRI